MIGEGREPHDSGATRPAGAGRLVEGPPRLLVRERSRDAGLRPGPAAYVFLTVIPMPIVFTSYIYRDPGALSARLEHRLRLEGETSKLFTAVMAGASGHKLSAALIAIIDLFFFGLGFGRVLQLVHARSWGLDLRKRGLLDQGLYAEALGAMALATLLFAIQTKALRGEPSWVGRVLDAAWLAVLAALFVWVPRLLLHRQVAALDILPEPFSPSWASSSCA